MTQLSVDRRRRAQESLSGARRVRLNETPRRGMAGVTAIDHSAGSQARRWFDRYRAWMAFLAALLVAAGLIGIWIWFAGAERRGLREMPAESRAALHREMLRNTEALCLESRTQPWLADRCRAAAQFLLLFPECQGDCADRARAYVSSP